MDFNRANVLCIQKQNTRMHIIISRHCDIATCSLNGLANTVDMAEGLMTAINLQKPLVNELRGQGVQMILTLKIILIQCLFETFYEPQIRQQHILLPFPKKWNLSHRTLKSSHIGR
jgi:hypothetical protein